MGNACRTPCDPCVPLCLEYIKREVAYKRDLKEKLHALQIQGQVLSDAWTDLKRRVEDAEQRTINRKRTEPVGGWLLRAEAAVDKANELLGDGPKETGRLCLGGYCSTNCMASHKFGKQVDQNLTDVKDLIGQCNFEELVETYLESVAELEVKLHSLQIERQRLSEEWTDLKRRVEDAELRMMNMKRREPVGGWLLRAEAAVAKANELIRDSPQEIERLCLAGECSTSYMSSHKFGEMVDQNLTDVKDLIGQSKFEVLVQRDLEFVADERPAEPDVVGLGSTLERVWRCLVEEPAGIVGLYGMAGVGKTTLLTHINNKFLKEPNDFNYVIWVVVSKDLRLEKIQESIWKKIGLFDESWKNKCVEEKALDIFRALKDKKFVLLLDDIWERVDLTKLGVPLPSPQNTPTSKIMFTTRFVNVCGSMGVYEKFEVECLSVDQAWELFQKNVDEKTLNSHPDILELAKLVAKECDGLPLALVTIGRAMAYRRTPEEWKYAIDELRRAASEFAGLGKEVYPRLKFSYDSLSGDAIKSCFLYCCLYPEDHKIAKRDLINCWICEGILDESNWSGARNQGYYFLGTLVQACLLEEEGDEYVKMHDVIRDMALWIACEIEQEKQGFMVCAGKGLTEAPNVRGWENMRRLSLMQNQIENILEVPTCPHLLTLFLEDNYNLKMITNGFFQSMTSIKVLKLSATHLFKLPLEISELVSLQLLDISNTYIEELPMELKALENLKYLNLQGARELATIPRQLICSFSKLHGLRMCGVGVNTLNKASKDSVLFGGGEVLFEELQSLKYLEVLEITLRSFNALQKFLSFQKLRSCTQTLELTCLEDLTSLDVSLLIDLRHLNRLLIRVCLVIEDLKIDCTQLHYVFNNLRNVEVGICHKLKDLTFLVFAPNLEFIYVYNCDAMEEIISVEKFVEIPEMIGNISPFAKLQRLCLFNSKNLKRIYRKPLPFSHLKEIRVGRCNELRKLPLDSESAKERKIVIYGEEDWMRSLEWEDEATQNTFLPCFQSFQW